MVSKVDKNFYDTLKILKNLKLNFCCSCGTMLGLYRDGDLIPWDEDIDIIFSASPEQYCALINAMKMKGFSGGFHRKFRPGLPVLKFHRSGGRKVEFSTPVKNLNGEYCLEWYKSEVPEIYRNLKYYQKLSHKFLKIIGRTPFQETQVGIRPCLYVDGIFKKGICFILMNFFSLIQSINNSLRKLTKIDSLIGYYSKRLDINNITIVKYFGLDCPIPADSEGVCIDLYGLNWKKPKGMKHFSDFYKDSTSQQFVKDQ